MVAAIGRLGNIVSGTACGQPRAQSPVDGSRRHAADSAAGTAAGTIAACRWTLCLWIVGLGLLAASIGCSPSDDSASKAQQQPAHKPGDSAGAGQSGRPASGTAASKPGTAQRGTSKASRSGEHLPPLLDLQSWKEKRQAGQEEPPRLLGDLLRDYPDASPGLLKHVPPVEIDEAKAAAVGIRKLSGKHITIYTDIPAAPEVDQLPTVFDQAVPQWCAYFGVEPAKLAEWHTTAFIMRKKQIFAETGLLPRDLPEFAHGYARNYEIWLFDQPSDYYRRHLLLHEGTHVFMSTRLGGCGPPWYMEGIAELLSTHLWREGKLTLAWMPASREDVPHWGRIKLIKEAVAAGRGKRLREVVDFPPAMYLDNIAYAWSWAAAYFLDQHPAYQQRFRTLYKHVEQSDLSGMFYKLFESDWAELEEQWELFTAGIEYGYDIRRNVIDFAPGKPLESEAATVVVAADRGWQNSGLRLEAGSSYRLRASGRYQVAQQGGIWWSEPNGVSIRYYRGRPLGILLAAVRPDPPPRDGQSALLEPVAVGLQCVISPEKSGTLFLKINDSPAELHDNAGHLQVEVRRQ